MRGIKREFRILGVDDAPFDNTDSECALICTVFRGGEFLDGVLSCIIEKDGLNVTEKLSRCVTGSAHHEQLQAIMLEGITFGGFNVVSITELSDKTGLPVIAIMRRKPDLKSFRDAIRKLPHSRKRLAKVEAAGKIMKCGEVFFQCAGIKPELAREVIKVSTTHSKIPEPIRAAHLIAHGIAGIIRIR